MHRATLALATCLAAPALAQPSPSKLAPNGFFSAPLIVGVDASFARQQVSTGAYLGIRPAIVVAWLEQSDSAKGFGLGLYGNAVTSTGTSQVWLGGGADVIGYFGYFGVAASAGIDVDWLAGAPTAVPAFGLFAGFRYVTHPGEGPFDFPFGLRVDVRPPLGPLPVSLAISAELDLVVAAAWLTWILTRGGERAD